MINVSVVCAIWSFEARANKVQCSGQPQPKDWKTALRDQTIELDIENCCKTDSQFCSQPRTIFSATQNTSIIVSHQLMGAGKFPMRLTIELFRLIFQLLIRKQRKNEITLTSLNVKQPEEVRSLNTSGSQNTWTRAVTRENNFREFDVNFLIVTCF